MSKSNCIGNCVGCAKVVHSLFDNLNDNELATLNTNRVKYDYNKGDIIYKEGDLLNGLICLNLGKVKLVKKGNIEDEFIIGLHKPVDFVGFNDLMYNSIASSSAIALEDTSICIIEKKQLFKVVTENSELAFKIISKQAQESISNNIKFLNIAQQNIESRLAFCILQLADFFGYESDNKTISVTLKRKELAALSNMNTANVIRSLSKFKSQNLIDTIGRKIVILNEDKLKNYITKLV